MAKGTFIQIGHKTATQKHMAAPAKIGDVLKTYHVTRTQFEQTKAYVSKNTGGNVQVHAVRKN